MELELEQRIFNLEKYGNKLKMEEDIKKYINRLKNDYPSAIVTREFYKGNSILVRATKINISNKKINIEREKEELQQEEVRIKEKGINGLGENVYREHKNEKTRQIEYNRGGNERERGGR